MHAARQPGGDARRPRRRAAARALAARRARPRRARARRAAGRLRDRLDRLRAAPRARRRRSCGWPARATGGANAVMLCHTIGALAWRFPERIDALGDRARRRPRGRRGAHVRATSAPRGCATSASSRDVLAECAEAAAERPELDLTPAAGRPGGADGTLRGGMVSDDGLQAAKEKMREAGVPDAAIATFAHYYEQLEAGESGMLPDDDLEQLADVPAYEDLPDEADRERARQDRDRQAQRRARDEHGHGAGQVAARGQGGPHLPRHHRRPGARAARAHTTRGCRSCS